MRIKKDFVTNSSSTSFIVEEKTTGKIMKEVLRVIETSGTSIPKLRKIEEVLNDPSFDKNLHLPYTLNEDTFVYRLCPAKVRVDTSHHYGWDELPFPIKYCKEKWNDRDYERSKEMKFFSLRYFEERLKDELWNERFEEEFEDED